MAHAKLTFSHTSCHDKLHLVGDLLLGDWSRWCGGALRCGGSLRCSLQHLAVQELVIMAVGDAGLACTIEISLIESHTVYRESHTAKLVVPMCLKVLGCYED